MRACSSTACCSICCERTTAYAYNAAGQLAFAVDALGKVIAYSYGKQGGASLLDTLRQLRLADASLGNPPSLNLLQAWASSSTVQQSLGKSQRTD